LSHRSEFPRPVAFDRLRDGLWHSLSADDGERRAVAERLELVALHALDAELETRRDPSGSVVTVRGHARADLERLCVVTLEPFRSEVEVAIDRPFTLMPARAADAVDIDPLLDEPDPLPPSGLDLGELVVEELVVQLDPYPRAPTAPPLSDEAVAAAAPAGPFAVLKRQPG
jgi:uncharacterized metal-binding protein YceD (DUF177 family)